MATAFYCTKIANSTVYDHIHLQEGRRGHRFPPGGMQHVRLQKVENTASICTKVADTTSVRTKVADTTLVYEKVVGSASILTTASLGSNFIYERSSAALPS